MDKNNLVNFIKEFQKYNMDVFADIYNEFKRLIFLYGNRLGGDDACQELTMFLIELLYTIDISTFENTDFNDIDRYIAVCLRNKYIALSKEKSKYEALHKDFFENIYESGQKLADKAVLDDALDELSYRQRQIINCKYIYGYSDTEIAAITGISRQAVNRLKNRAIENLRIYFCCEE